MLFVVEVDEFAVWVIGVVTGSVSCWRFDYGWSVGSEFAGFIVEFVLVDSV